jgi:type VI secretion system protein ImpJ
MHLLGGILNRQTVPDPVCWQEGMRLMPQHFQYLAKRADQHSAHLAATAFPFYWGVSNITVTLAGSILRLQSCGAIMPDGTPVQIELGAPDEPGSARLSAQLEIDLSRQTDENGSYLISLACEAPTPEALQTLVATRKVEDAFSRRAAAVATWQPRLLLVCGVPPGFVRDELLPVARCMTRLGTYYIDDTYIAPTPLLASQTRLKSGVGDMCQLLRNKYREFADRFVARRALKSELEADPMELERLMQNQWMLALLGQHLIEMEGLHALPHTHPYQVYQALLRLCGALTATAAQPECPSYPPFNYRDLHASLYTVWSDINAQLDRFLPPYDLHFFRKESQGRYTLTLHGCPVGDRFIIGIEPGKGLATADVIEWMRTAIVGPASQIEAIGLKRVPGYARAPLPDAEALRLEVYHAIVLFEITVAPAHVPSESDTLVVMDGGRDTPALRLPRSVVLLRPRKA